MQKPLQITIHNVEQSDALDAHVREKVQKLREFYDRITSCHVTVELLHKHQHQGREFGVRLVIGVPGSEIVASRNHDEDVYVAVRDAFDAATRQLEDYARKMRGAVKTHQAGRAEIEVEEGGEGAET